MDTIVAPLRGSYSFALATDQGLRCSPPLAIQVAPLRGGLPENSHRVRAFIGAQIPESTSLRPRGDVDIFRYHSFVKIPK